MRAELDSVIPLRQSLIERKRSWRVNLHQDAKRPWGLSAHSICGPVRRANEDFVISVSAHDAQILVFADGCGGVPHGDIASRQAAMTASSILALHRGEYSEPLLRRSFQAANHALQQLGEQFDIESLSGGLRTTLVVVVATKECLHVGYIGDGACDLVYPTGEIERLLVPQRSEGNSSSLEASLGPTPHGAPVFLSIVRPPNSLVLCGTDGVFDRIGETGFHHAMMERGIRLEGDLDRTIETTLSEFAAARGDYGFVCDDNMTLGLLGPGRSPKLSQRFWSHAHG